MTLKGRCNGIQLEASSAVCEEGRGERESSVSAVESGFAFLQKLFLFFFSFFFAVKRHYYWCKIRRLQSGQKMR